jgi:hypothetical protein
MTRTLRAPFLALTLALAMMFAFALPATADSHEGLLTDISQQVVDASGGVLSAADLDLAITNITREGDQLLFDGNVTGTVTEAATGDVFDVDAPFQDVAGDLERGNTRGNQGNRCDILFLDLGPLELDVLGLVVDLSDVQLDVYAVPGAGNLLGNLLCAVAGLLDGPGIGGGIGNAIDNLLNRVTGILDGLLG